MWSTLQNDDCFMGGQQEINMKLYYSFDWLGRGQRACTTANAGWKTEHGFILQEFYVGVKYSRGTEITQDGQSWPGWAGLAEQKKKKDEVSTRISAGKRVLHRQNLPRTASVLTHMLTANVQLSDSSIKNVLCEIWFVTNVGKDSINWIVFINFQ